MPRLTYLITLIDVETWNMAGVLNCRADGKQQALHCLYLQLVHRYTSVTV